MILCIGTGGHARALELPDGIPSVNATPEDIEAGLIEIPDLVILGVGHPNPRGATVRERVVMALHKARPGVAFPTVRVGVGFEHDDLGRHIFRSVHIGPGATIGAHSIINTGAIIEHDVSVGAFSHVAPGAIICGGAHIGRACLVGAGAVVLPGVVVHDGQLVRAGEVRKR